MRLLAPRLLFLKQCSFLFAGRSDTPHRTAPHSSHETFNVT